MKTGIILQELDCRTATDGVETLKSIRKSKQQLEQAVEELYADYKGDKNLTAFTSLDAVDFYEAR